MQQIVLNGNNIDLLKNYPDNYFDAVVTDPPYGLGKEPNAESLMRDWLDKGYHEVGGTGFMGKEWDAFIPQPIFWKEVFRVLKHGGHVVSFFGTRTYDWGVMAMRFAGFEVRDCIQWIYGSGFPKSHNIGKAIDKIEGNEREVVGEQIIPYKDKDRSVLQPKDGWNDNSLKTRFDLTKGNSEWEGWGSALKPANEPIVLARKPLENGLSIAENVLKWGTGGINIDGCRVGTYDEISNHSRGAYSAISKGKYGDSKEQETHQTEGQKLGRFPANLILTHHPECECEGLKKVKGQIDKPTNRTKFDGTWNEGNTGLRNNTNASREGYADENGKETIEDWDCHEDCPIRILDEQSGISKSSDAKRTRNTIGSFGMPDNSTPEYSDKGGASRFFYCAKASKSERNKGLEGFEEKQTIGGGGTYNEEAAGKYGSIKAEAKNFHPTVKPIKLMQYLARLITPPNGIVLDPFCGSGTTGIACKLEGFEFVGMEQDPEYTKIAQARIENYKEEKEGVKQREIKKEETSNELINQLNLF
jgi:DNA modification methylase